MVNYLEGVHVPTCYASRYLMQAWTIRRISSDCCVYAASLKDPDYVSDTIVLPWNCVCAIRVKLDARLRCSLRNFQVFWNDFRTFATLNLVIKVYTPTICLLIPKL